MAKTTSLIERVQTNEKSVGRRTSGLDRPTLLALRDEILQTLEQGWSAKAIWRTLHQERVITVRYHAFLKQLKRLKKSAAQAKGSSASPPSQVTSPALTGFTFTRPKQEDLT